MTTPEPARDSLLRDTNGDIWEYSHGGWHQHPLWQETESIEWYELNIMHGPLREFKAIGVI